MTALVASVTALCVGLSLASGADGSHTSMPMTLLVEGRVALKVPAPWAVQRISSGPGSARVEVTSPDDSTAVLITQSQVHRGESLAVTSAALRNALDDQQTACSAGSIPMIAVRIGRPPRIGNSVAAVRSTGRCSSTTPCGSASVAKAHRAVNRQSETSAKKPFGRRTRFSDLPEPNTLALRRKHNSFGKQGKGPDDDTGRWLTQYRL